MKTTIKIFILFYLLFSCKPNNQSKTSTNQDFSIKQEKDICDEYTSFEEITNEEEQLKWIEEHKDDLCNGKLDYCIIKNHELNDSIYKKYIENFWGTTTPKEKKYTWKEIKDTIKNECYEKYIVFSHSNGEITNMKLDTNFKADGLHYSAPLFRGIDLFCGGLNDSDEFVFTIGKNDKEKVNVLFKVKNKTASMYYFDIADDPSFTDLILLFNKINVN